MPLSLASAPPADPPAASRTARLLSLLLPLETVTALLFTLASVYLHILQRHAAGGLWRDEATSVQVANLPTLGQLWRYLEFDSYPPLFHFLLRLWNALFSSTDASLRTLGLLIGLAILACFWVSARALNVRVPLFALVLLGLNPMMIRYGDSLRAYGLGCGLALLTLVAVWRVTAAERPDGRRVTLAALTAILSVQCLYHNAALLLATCLGGAAVALWRRRPVVAATVLAIGLPAALSLLPYLPTIARTRRWSVLLKFPITPAWLWDKLSDVTGSPDPLGVWLWAALVLLGCVLAASTLRSVRSPYPGSSPQLFAALTLAAAAVVYAAFLFAVGYVTQPWYYLAFLALAAVCLDAIFGQPTAAPGWRVLRLVIVILFAILTFAQTSELLRQRSTDLDLVAAKLHSAATPADLVLVNRWECAISLHRYDHGPAPLMTIPPVDDHCVHRYDLFMRGMQTPDPLRPVFDAITATLRRGGRVWLVGHPRLLHPGDSLPDLPPVIVPPGGEWPFTTYYYGWEQQADEFLQAHAVASLPVPIPLDAPVSNFENQDLSYYTGWRDE